MATHTLDDYELYYGDISFKLMIPDYWVKIYRGQKREALYPDYCAMLDVLKQANKNKYVLDIGANHGLFSVPASKMGYKVVGFEPVAANYETLKYAKELNNLTNYDMLNLALSNKNGEVEMFVPECPDNASFSATAAVSNMRGKEYNVEKVETVRFDDWVFEHPDYIDIGFIKMDAQGAEYMILEGMKEYLTGAKDVLLICEYEHHLNTMGYTFEQLDDLILSYGFRYVRHISPNDKLFYKQ